MTLTPQELSALTHAARTAVDRVHLAREATGDDRVFVTAVANMLGRALAIDQATLVEEIASPSDVVADFATTLFAAYAREMARRAQ